MAAIACGLAIELLKPEAVLASLRLVEQRDCAAVAGLVRAAFAALPQPVQPSPSALQVGPDHIAAHLAAGGGGVLSPGRACVLWAEREGGLHLSRLAVLPQWRRQGLASGLLRCAESEARRRGLAAMRASTRLALAGNRRLFAGYGFVEMAQHAHPGFAAPTYVDMEKRLAPCAS